MSRYFMTHTTSHQASQLLMTGRSILQISSFRITALEIILQDLVVRRPATSVRISTGPQRGYHKRMEEDLTRDSSKIHCTVEKTIESSQWAEWWRDSAHFSPVSDCNCWEISCIL